MDDKYDNKNNYGDFKRNMPQEHINDHQQDQDGEDAGKLHQKADDYLRDLLSEKIKIDQAKLPLIAKLLDQEVTRVQTTGRLPSRESKYVDVYQEKPVKVVVKVLVPIKEHPKFNFVGKLLGPKGNTLKHLQEETMCKMAILGRGSMKDRKKEEELRNALEPKHAHLLDQLHVEVSALGPPAEAHARIAYALAEVRKYLQPDMDGMQPPPMRGLIDRPGPRGGMAMGRGGHPPPRMAPGPPHGMQRPGPGMPNKTKVLSILDRARNAMEDYPYEDVYGQPEPPVRAPHNAPEPEYYAYERGPERYYEDTGYYKEEPPREYNKPHVRDVATRRPPAARHYARASPYSRQSK